MNFLVIDDDEDIYKLLNMHISRRWPGSGTSYYNPLHSGLPEAGFDWSEYDILLLDYDIGLGNTTGLDIISRVHAHEKYPIIILITGEGNEKLAVKAIQCGADDYLIKYDIVTERFHEVIEDALKIREISDRNATGRTGSDKNLLYDEVLSIPDYRDIKLINQGTSFTFRATHTATGEPVALKVHNLLDNSGRNSLQRFQQELQILSGIDHPNIIRIRDQGTTKSFLYYAMEYIDRGDLGHYLRKGPIKTDLAVQLFMQIASGLKALHEREIIHRDLKSNNILFRKDDEIVIADLGSAKNLATSIDLTLHGEIIGTPFYMSPEQFNSGSIDYRSDIYSLGILFYEMLLGKKPFTGNNIMEIVYKHSYEIPPPLPVNLQQYNQFLQTMIAKKPDDRFQSIDEVINIMDTIR